MKKGRIEDAARILDETADAWTTGNLSDGFAVDLEEARKLVQHFSGSIGGIKLSKKEKKLLVAKCITLKKACG